MHSMLAHLVLCTLLAHAFGAGTLEPSSLLDVHWQYSPGGDRYEPGFFNCVGVQKPATAMPHSCMSGAGGNVYYYSDTRGTFYRFKEGQAPSEVKSMKLTVDISAFIVNSYGGSFPHVNTEVLADVLPLDSIPSGPFNYTANWKIWKYNESWSLTPPEEVQQDIVKHCGPVNFGYTGPASGQCTPTPCLPQGPVFFPKPIASASANVSEAGAHVTLDFSSSLAKKWWLSPFVLRLTSPDACFSELGGMAPLICSTKPGGEIPITPGHLPCGYGDVSRGPKGDPYSPTKMAHASFNVSTAVKLQWA